MTKINVIGAGAWGTALAITARNCGNDVLLWTRQAEHASALNRDRTNRKYLDNIPLPSGIEATDDLARAADADILLLVVPAQHVRDALIQLKPDLSPDTVLVMCAKGIEQNSGKLMSEVLNESLPDAMPAILSGPSFASDVAKGLPTAVTLACAEKKTAENFANAIGSPSFRPYWTADVKGAQIGGAIKNVLAIACGIVDGKGLGESARAALTARGFVEMTRFGLSLGAARETLTGLSGLGDLILTCTSSQSRNMSLGYALGQGQSLKDIMEGRTSVAEGVHTASAVADLARKRRLDLPIMEAINTIVTGTKPLDDVIAELLARPFTAEQ